MSSLDQSKPIAVTTTHKQHAFEFLRTLHAALVQGLPPPAAMCEQIRLVVSSAKQNKLDGHKQQPEDAFLHHFAFPVLFEQLLSTGLTSSAAKNALLSEYYRKMPEWCSTTPARKLRHPFDKVLGKTSEQIMARWKGQAVGAQLKQSCPDFALRHPFPHKIVFEGKYYDSGGQVKAENMLVSIIYQAFFYLALPRDESLHNNATWDYDYACLLAYDASPEGSLLKAWSEMSPEVRNGFWDGGNIYVMIVRGDSIEIDPETHGK